MMTCENLEIGQTLTLERKTMRAGVVLRGEPTLSIHAQETIKNLPVLVSPTMLPKPALLKRPVKPKPKPVVRRSARIREREKKAMEKAQRCGT